MNKEDKYATLVLFGATGDLAKRKLFPALYSLYCDGYLPERFAVVGLGRRSLTQEDFYHHIKDSLEAFSRYDIRPEDWEGFIQRFHYVQLDINQASDYEALASYVEKLEQRQEINGNRLFYLAIAPGLFEPVTFQLKEAGLLQTKGWKRLIIEKPFGHSHESAEELNDKITQVFKEEEIYRIDHYLGKEMIQNIQVIRFANSFFEPLWNNQYIASIQLTSSETVGVENRGSYYDKVGALRDMVQNHMLQMVTMMAMEPPSRLKAEAIRDEKVKVLRSIRRMETEQEIQEHVVRGQYEAGELQGEGVKGYREEQNVAEDSSTETFVAAKIMVDNFRWAGVPFYIRTGKRLPSKATEIIIQFKSMPYLYFNKDGNLAPNLLVIQIFPEEGIHLKFNAKKPGTEGSILPISMDFCHDSTVGINSPEAYERLLNDVLEGDSTYFTRWDEVSLAWKIVDPIIQSWEKSEGIPLSTYKAGQWGPTEAKELLEKDGFHWWQVFGEK
ncbi:glucose-6-phosphate dehydrogenase [Bacillus horti]|uniref:Glucose-6-phosphate 1-dehydrogenase n=1 Tax=Caldalkalibacillus horti TaxID=77523 RepID=A0ABT9W4C0_9BACI|nr:glucose-6-phosphate dehydrogenase [Bacillus horti]MDQ0168074.1 glucose-6-phosphate 1-dehydrogenase [Bacillus horti]